MSKIADLLAGRPDSVWSVTSNQSVLDAIKLMAEKNIGAVCVIDDGNLHGIFSERDFVRKMVVQNKSADQTTLADVMTCLLYTSPSPRDQRGSRMPSSA